MQAGGHDRTLAARAGVRARLLTDRDDLADAVRLLDRAEARAGAPLVDESERQRLEAAVAGDGDLEEHHHAVLADRGGRCVGYAGVVVHGGDRHGVGDVAVERGPQPAGDVLRTLLEALDVVVRDHDAHGTQLWIRHAEPDDVVSAVAAGYAVERRLAVLGRSLPVAEVDDVDDVEEDHAVRVRPSRREDVDGIVATLAAAYRGTPDEGWDRQRFEGHTDNDWFRFEDLLVAEDDGGLLGLHWTKRRGEHTGEVYNLAVAPRGQGHGLGRRLLDAGLAHLHGIGCREALLWVDLANEAAVRLYATAGFTARWEDIAFLRHARPVGRHQHPVQALMGRRT